MKKVVGLIILMAALTSCGVGSSDNVSISGDDVQYVKDERTGLCFAYVGASHNLSMDTQGLGFACVPCDSLKNVEVK